MAECVVNLSALGLLYLFVVDGARDTESICSNIVFLLSLVCCALYGDWLFATCVIVVVSLCLSSCLSVQSDRSFNASCCGGGSGCFIVYVRGSLWLCTARMVPRMQYFVMLLNLWIDLTWRVGAWSACSRVGAWSACSRVGAWSAAQEWVHGVLLTHCCCSGLRPWNVHRGFNNCLVLWLFLFFEMTLMQ